MWDGLVGDPESIALTVHPDIAGWTLNLTEQGKGMEGARPAPLDVGVPGGQIAIEGWGAGAELEARLK